MPELLDPCFWIFDDYLGKRCDGKVNVNSYGGVHQVVCSKCGFGGPLRKTRQEAIQQYNQASKWLDRVKVTEWDQP